jgi:hypothetical protein
MALKSDSQGFLIGEVVSDILRNPLLASIRADVRDIKTALLGATSGGKGSKNAKIDGSAKIAPPISQRNRDNGPSKVATPARSKGASNLLPPAPKKAATPNGRDASTGKFTKKEKSDDGSNNPAPDDKKSQSLISNLASRITSTTAGAAAGAEEVDPSIKAFKEVSEPMMRGYQTIFGGGDKKESWYKKIFKELNLFRKDESAFNKAENKVLKNIAEKPGGGGEESPGFLGGLMGSISPWVMAAITGVGGALLTGVTAVLGAIFSPIGLAIAAAGAVAWGLFTESGQKFFANMGGKIAEGWDRAVDWFIKSSPKTMELINKGVDKVNKGIEVVADAGNAANDFVNDKTGVNVKEEVMPGYRHKALFDGIKGGDSLTKNGSYTDEEAAKIRELKTSGANTSANVKGGMSLEIQDKISAQAKLNGLDPVMMQKMAAMESGGNANAVSSTGAAGIYQFTGQTASGVGIKNRFDADQNIEGGMKLTKQNSAVLEKSGLPVNAENLYMMHQLGPSAAKEVIMGAASSKSKTDMSASTQKAMNLNYGSNSKTAEDYIATNKKALDDRYASVTKDTGGAQTALAKADDPTQAGRYKYETLEGGSVQVTDSQDGTIGLASDEQANAYRKQQGQAYKNQVASINAMPSLNNLAAGPRSATQTAYAAAPKIPTFSPVSAPAEAPQVKQYLASNSDRNTAAPAPSIDVGQDIKDRNIAHIATGGFSGRG